MYLVFTCFSKADEGYCQKNPNCAGRYFGKNYRYVGGFFGGCSHEAMMVALVQNGPLAVTYAPMVCYNK